ncbi:MAG: tripartite tricarboxylate transporter TctB family protein [Arenicellaceae bacterium]|nr:tripartite tricarboxylate transporter TctB family protein [Arenicellaceae bacterium]
MFSRDLVGGLVTIVLGSLYLVFSFRQRVSALADSIGPAGMPKVLGFLMVALGIVLCIQAIYQYRKSALSSPTEWDGIGGQILRAFGLVCIAILYIYLIAILGYVPSIALLLAAVAIYLGATISWRLAVIALCGSLALWAIFVLLLDVPMPAGILFQN